MYEKRKRIYLEAIIGVNQEMVIKEYIKSLTKILYPLILPSLLLFEQTNSDTYKYKCS